jgi:pyruvate dehydrogenase E1 component beta subunit
LAWSVPIIEQAAEQLSQEGISAEVIDLRTLVPLDAATVLASVAKTSRILIVEENPFQGGWGGTLASIVADEAFDDLDAPVKRLAAACVPLPFATHLEDQVLPSVAGSWPRPSPW